MKAMPFADELEVEACVTSVMYRMTHVCMQSLNSWLSRYVYLSQCIM